MSNIHPSPLLSDLSKDTQYFKFDQLPPFNLTLLFNDEYGYASYQRLLGVRFVSDGVVYGSQDMYTEQTLTYLASDFTPLLPLGLSSFLSPITPSSGHERTPSDALKALQLSELGTLA